MAHRHYGYDVKVMTIDSTDIKALYESCDISIDPIVKETQSAQDTGPNKRVFAEDFTVSISKFLQGSADFLSKYCQDNKEDINLTIVMSEPTAVAGGGITMRTITINNAICSKIGINLSGDGTKETFEFTRGYGGGISIL